MNINYKLLFKYIMFNLSHLYLTHYKHGSKNITLITSQHYMYYLAIHLKLSSILYASQLVDMFAYELPIAQSANNEKTFAQPTGKHSSVSNTIVVYNFHNLVSQERFFVFTSGRVDRKQLWYLQSVTELFPNSNWLEREIAELHGIKFKGKKDLRNLMLTYGDTSAPFQKMFPSIGLRELFYDAASDSVIQVEISTQI